MLDGRPIDIYNNGDVYRNFSYVEDRVRAIYLLIDVAPVCQEDDVVLRGGSVCLNSICQVVKWISALFMQLPGLAAAV